MNADDLFSSALQRSESVRRQQFLEEACRAKLDPLSLIGK